MPIHFFSKLPVDERACGGFKQKNCWALSDWRSALSRKHSWAWTNFAAGRLWTDIAPILFFSYFPFSSIPPFIWHFKMPFFGIAHIYLGRHRVAGTDTPRHWKSSTNTSQFEMRLRSTMSWGFLIWCWSSPIYPPLQMRMVGRRRFRRRWLLAAGVRDSPGYSDGFNIYLHCLSNLTWRWFNQGSPPSSSRTADRIGNSLQ